LLTKNISRTGKLRYVVLSLRYSYYMQGSTAWTSHWSKKKGEEKITMMIHTLLYNERIKILVACEKEMTYSLYECWCGGRIMTGS